MFCFGYRKPRTLIVVMIALVFTGVMIAYFYYNGINKSMDPRIRDARELYEKYNGFAESGEYDSVFWLMDTIQSIYNSFEHYKHSYEVGVLYNNRAATWLSIFLQPEMQLLIDDTTTFLKRAEAMALESINLYQHWMEEFSGMDEEKIRGRIGKDFTECLESFDAEEQQDFLDNRVKEIMEAMQENSRRLSVSYTNLGTIKRHQQLYDSAVYFYLEAVNLWDQNLTAENNLNILLNRPLKKRNLIQKLFPPER